MMDDESSKADKLSRKMHSFIIRKGNKQYLGITSKIKNSRESLDDFNDDDEFTFLPKKKDDDNDWEKLDNEQKYVQNKRNKKDNDNKDSGGSGTSKIHQ
jgi:hypothetical protein